MDDITLDHCDSALASEILDLRLKLNSEEMDATEYAVEELIEISDSVNANVTLLETALESKTLTAQGLELAKVSIAVPLARLGMSVEDNVPSLESFDDSNVEAKAEVALEGLKDIIKKIWAAIKNAVKGMIEDFKLGFQFTNEGFDKLEKDVKGWMSTLNSLNKSDWKAPEGATIKIDNPDTLRIDGKLDARVLIDGLKGVGILEKPVDKFAGAAYNLLQDRLKEFKQGLGDSPEEKYILLEGKGSDIMKDVSRVVDVGILPGDTTLRVKLVKDVPVMRIVRVDNAKTYTGPNEIPVLTKSELVSLGAELVKTYQLLAKASNVYPKLIDLQEKSIKAIDGIVKDAKDGTPLANFLKGASGKRLMSNTVNITVKSLLAIFTMTYKWLLAYNTIIKRSFRQYKSESA